MGTKTSNGFQWLEDSETGDPTGVRRARDGKGFTIPRMSDDGLSLVSGDGTSFAIAPRAAILNGASAGADSGWLPLSANPERFVYQLDSGTTTTTFSVDISADGSTSLGQAFTGTYASSTVAEITFPIMFSNPLAKFFRWNVLSGGPLSVSRGA